MNPFDLTSAEARALWIADLRSGKYEQGRCALHVTSTDDGRAEAFCCLGVACETFLAQGGSLYKIETPQGVVTYDGLSGTLPKVVREWLGLMSAAGLLWDGSSLTERNDGGESFAHIADRIERGDLDTALGGSPAPVE